MHMLAKVHPTPLPSRMGETRTARLSPVFDGVLATIAIEFGWTRTDRLLLRRTL